MTARQQPKRRPPVLRTPEPEEDDVVRLSVRMTKDLHRRMRQWGLDHDEKLNDMLIKGAELLMGR